MKHTFSLLVKNDPGVLKNVISVLGDNNRNIDSLAVGVTEDAAFSRITIVSDIDDPEYIISSLRDNPHVIRAKLLAPNGYLSRSHVLVKVSADAAKRGQVIQVSDIFRAKAVDVSHNTVTLEMTGDENKVNALISMLRPFGIEEIVRSGVVAIERGDEKL